ncbi:class I ribonucleotide reductase maintenance protein YfaE [Alteromonas sp. LMIT007]|uniref:Class I ribonucleotide reductase maintenance protein YfaE n=2 Tax=Opacimonas viscosa TaxID=2961944 RepID=A0AA42BK70_9ALTE|nr:class I ribonucleotide reductase maintenance protein YfaE [Opacimonas viscosa]
MIRLSDGSAFSSSKDTILEDLEENNVTLEYHCREGFCGACRCKLISGEVDYTIDPLAFIDDDEILPCCTIPLTDIMLDI